MPSGGLATIVAVGWLLALAEPAPSRAVTTDTSREPTSRAPSE
jgi:hypothetical protein